MQTLIADIVAIAAGPAGFGPGVLFVAVPAAALFASVVRW